VDVMSSIDFSNIINNESSYLTKIEINQMLKAVLESKYKIKHHKFRNYLLILILYRTGRRISELVGTRPFTIIKGLRPCDIDFDKGLIEWDILKKNPVRLINQFTGRKKSKDKLFSEKTNKKPKRLLLPIDSNTLIKVNKFITKYHVGQYDRLFPVNRKRAWQLIQDISIKAGVKRDNMKIHPHMFRHSFAINFLKNNLNDTSALSKVKIFLDHSSLQVTQGYLKITDEVLKNSINDIFK
jgi:integrase